MEEKLKIVIQRIESNREVFDNKLCTGYWFKLKRLAKDFDEDKLWELLTDNIAWVINLEFISTKELQEWFTEDELNKHNIYSKGIHKVQGGRHIGINEAHLVSTLHTEIILFDAASAACYDTSFLTCYNKSTGTANECMATAMGESEIIANGARVELFDNAKCTDKGNSLIIKR